MILARRDVDISVKVNGNICGKYKLVFFFFTKLLTRLDLEDLDGCPGHNGKILRKYGWSKRRQMIGGANICAKLRESPSQILISVINFSTKMEIQFSNKDKSLPKTCTW